MDAQDLSLFIGQEVQTPHGISKLLSVTEYGVSARNDTGNTYEYRYAEMKEIKPICRKNMTEEEKREFYTKFNGVLSMPSLLTYEEIKYLTSKGICPFQIWIDEGIVTLKIK